jgi:hypothetical protein
MKKKTVALAAAGTDLAMNAITDIAAAESADLLGVLPLFPHLLPQALALPLFN